jgi:hypothetical protein
MLPRIFSVKVLWNSKSEIQALLESNPSLKQKRDALEGKPLSMEEVIEIGQMIASGLQLRKQQAIALFREQLNGLAEEVVAGETMTEEMIYNAAYLIFCSSESDLS